MDIVTIVRQDNIEEFERVASSLTLLDLLSMDFDGLNLLTLSLINMSNRIAEYLMLECSFPISEDDIYAVIYRNNIDVLPTLLEIDHRLFLQTVDSESMLYQLLLWDFDMLKIVVNHLSEDEILNFLDIHTIVFMQLLKYCVTEKLVDPSKALLYVMALPHDNVLNNERDINKLIEWLLENGASYTEDLDESNPRERVIKNWFRTQYLGRMYLLRRLKTLPQDLLEYNIFNEIYEFEPILKTEHH
jgi:hypothetical protein